MELESKSLENFKDSLIESLFEGAYFVDVNRTVTYWNKAAERISGYTRDQVVNHCCADNLLRHVDEAGHELCLDGCPLAATLADGQFRQAEVYLHHKEGHRVPVLVRVTPVRDLQDQIIGAVELFTEKRERQKLLMEMERLKKEVFKDELTKIANRKFAMLQIRRFLQELKSLHIPLGIFMIDIDYFKNVNDTYGHNAGDLVLKMVAKTIELSLREMDVVARWGGEEFLALLPNVTVDELKLVAERIRMQIQNSWVHLNAQENLSVTVSVGGIFASGTDTVEDAIERADQKLFAAKREGRNRVNI